MERNDAQLPQKLTLEDRSRLGVSGVQDIESFDENAVVLRTCRGTLIVRGRELHLRQLSMDGGQVAVDGQVDALLYEDTQKEGSFWSRLLR